MKLFIPDDYQPDISCYTPDYLRSRGKRAILCDIDNTLVTYDDPEPTEKILLWTAAMREAGITVGFVSNNTHERVNRFNASLGFFAYPDAHKPGTKGIRQFLAESGCTPDEVAHVGDQIFTDVLMAHAVGVTALLVPPIKDKTTLFFRIKRLGEKPFLRYYLRKQKKNVQKTL